MPLLPYILSLGLGVIVGAIYGLTGVKSPAPPIIALVGLLGIVGGEGGISFLRGHSNVVGTMLHRKSFAIDDAAGVSSPVLTNNRSDR